MKVTVAVLSKKDENSVPAVVSVLKQMKETNAKFALATEKTIVSGKEIDRLAPDKLYSAVSFGFASNAPTQSQPYAAQLKEGTLLFDGRIYTPTQKPTIDFATKQMEKPNPPQAAKTFLQNTEGEYYIILAQASQLVAARDPVGVQPLYYAENESIAALASDRKSLWKLNLTPKCFPPGQVATITAKEFYFEPAKTLNMEPPKPLTMEQAADTLQKRLSESIQKRVADQKKVAVAFSGGLDSSVVAYIAKHCGMQVELFHVSLESQSETEAALQAAELLDLPIQVHLYKESDVEKTVPKVVELIEEADPVKVSIGMPFYWTAEKAAEADYHVMLAGQGADELFGGYQRYVNQFMAEGEESVRETMFHDVALIHETNVERDEKLCIFHNVELRLPFGSYSMAEFAMSLPTELKFEAKTDTLRKLVLRKVAKNLGLPNQIADKPKKAVQYSTGMSNTLKKIAKQHNQPLQEYIQKIFEKQKSSR